MRLHAFAACAWVLLAQSCTCPWDLPESCPNQVHQKDEHSWKVKPALKCRWRKAVWRHPTSDISTQILFHLEKGRVSVGLTGVDWLRTICRYLFWSFFIQLDLMFPTWRAMGSWKKYSVWICVVCSLTCRRFGCASSQAEDSSEVFQWHACQLRKSIKKSRRKKTNQNNI